MEYGAIALCRLLRHYSCRSIVFCSGSAFPKVTEFVSQICSVTDGVDDASMVGMGLSRLEWGAR